MFREYAYFSSVSDEMVEHARRIAERMIDRAGLDAGSLVIELASNDGYLLQHYVAQGIPVLGIDPARNVAEAATGRGIPTLAEFFDAGVADDLRRTGRLADVVHANNVLAHVPDLHGFVAGIATILKPNGVAVIETPYVRDLVERLEFDTIYHEHVFYYSLSALARVLDDHGLQIADVERIPIHGGSLRVFVQRAGSIVPSPAVAALLDEEQALGMTGVDYFDEFAARVGALGDELRGVLEGLKQDGPLVIGASLVWISIQYASDRPQGGINVLDLASQENVHHPLPGRPGFFAETADPGILLVGMEHRLVLYDLIRGAVTDTLAHIPEDPRVIINDGIAIPGGAIFGTKHLEFSEPVAALYHYDNATRQVRELLAGQTCSNGKYLHDGLLVDIDTQPKTITEYRYDGALHRLRLIVQPQALPALPDGLRPMPGGQSMIVAYFNPAHVADGLAQEIRLSDGEVLTEWILPGSPRVTCPELGELDGAPCVFFTTATEGMPDATRAIAPQAGTIFVAALTA